MNDHVKNQLCARIEELESEKMELNEQIDALQEGRDALAAHVERLEDIIERSTLADSPAAESALDDSPTTSLARLKAQWQAEVLGHASDRVSLAVEADTVLAHLRNQAAKLRRQAKARGEP